MEEDKRLENWKKWISIRISEQAKISKFVGRDSTKLIMNSEECYRKKNEQRKIIYSATNLALHDHSKGDCSFWKLPPKLSCKCKFCPPIYAQISPIENGLVPDLMSVGTSKFIRKEKGLGTDDEANLYAFDNSEYKLKRENDLHDKISAILPHRPEMDELIVIGKCIFKAGENIVESILEDNLEKIKSVKSLISDTVALRIENTILIGQMKEDDGFILNNLKKQEWHESKKSWRINFISKSYVTCNKSIKMYNLGTTPIKYEWRRINNDIPSFSNEPILSAGFVFDKNNGTIEPEEMIDIDFAYQSCKADVISIESWQFFTEPALLTEDEKIIFRLHGVTIADSNYRRRMKKLQENITHKMAVFAVNDFLNTIFDEISFTKPINISYKEYFCNEEIIFSLKNSNCYYHYDEETIKSLNDIYCQIFPESATKWDFSVMNLRTAIIHSKSVKKTALFSVFKDCCLMLMKPKYNYLLSNSKHVVIFSLLSKFLNKFDVMSNEINFKYNNSTLNKIEIKKMFYNIIYIEFNTLINDICYFLNSIQSNECNTAFSICK